MRRPTRYASLILAVTLIGGCNASVESDLASSSTTLEPAPTTDPGVETTTTTTPVATVTTTENFVRFIHPDEWTIVMETCMNDAGWVVTTTFDGGIQYPQVSEEQRPAMSAYFDSCNREMFPIDPRFKIAWTTEQVTFLYDWYLAESIPCLEGHGFTGFDPPSLDVFIDTYETQERWAPYREIDIENLPDGDWETLNDECPQTPPLDVILSH